MAAADVIVANAPRAAEVIREAFPSARDRIIVITNGYDPEAFAGLADDLAPPDGPLRILHPGQLYAGRDPRPLLDALRAIRAGKPAGSRPILFDLIGHLEGDERAYDLEGEIRARGLEGVVTLSGQIPYARALKEMVRSDILMLLDSPGRTIGVPAKLYEYLGAGRPVLALGESESDLAWVLRESGILYRIVAPTDTAAIEQALGALIAELEAGCAVTTPGRRLAFTRENTARQLADVLNRCTRGDPTAGLGPAPRGRADHSPIAATRPSEK